MENVKVYAKFLVAAVGVAVTLGLLDAGTAQTVAGAITALAVFLVPNATA